MQRKTKFAWASIAGAEPEPVEVINEAGRTGVLTTGCADPFWLDDESVGVLVYAFPELVRPVNPETEEQRDLREAIYKARKAAEKAAYEWHREHAKHGPDCPAAGCIGKAREYVHGWRDPR